MKLLRFILFSSTVRPMNKAAGRPRAADIEARHQNLIETAGELFLNIGYGNVSLELIARHAHVAVRTIYVKFGGKAGLFQAVLIANRDRFFAPQKLETDTRPLKEALAVQRMVIAEAKSNPELAQSFFEAGPRQSREALSRFFERPDVRVQLREDVATELLPNYLINCVMGDPFSRFLFGPPNEPRETVRKHLHQRLDLFYTSVLR